MMFCCWFNYRQKISFLLKNKQIFNANQQRDLKMENVMLNQSQTQIKIVDFGLSNIWNSENPLQTHCGSPEYAAPELFVAGKVYGPEVDIWSLGIILYGMVVGQLPFVASHSNQLSLHDRRRRLADQLVKGLVAKQRQALAPLSLEFRTMISKLLVPQPFKRTTIQELLNHSWLTERGKKSILKNPYPKLIKQLSKMLQLDYDTVLKEFSEKPFGRYGGMLNILRYEQIIETFDPSDLAPLTTSLHTTGGISSQKSASKVKSQHTLYNQWMVILDNATIKEENNSTSQIKDSTQKSTIIKKITQDTLETSKNRPKNIKSSTPLNKFVGAEESKTIANKSKRPNTTKHGIYTGFLKPVTRNKNESGKSAGTKVDSLKPKTSSNRIAMGDGIKITPYNTSCQKFKIKDPLVNDPIARSIAGYLVKNVPEHMFNISKRLH